jgi:hypothetical protein
VLTPDEYRTLLELFKRADTPTEVVREALGAEGCDIALRYEHGSHASAARPVTAIIKDINRSVVEWDDSE